MTIQDKFRENDLCRSSKLSILFSLETRDESQASGSSKKGGKGSKSRGGKKSPKKDAEGSSKDGEKKDEDEESQTE